MGLLKRLRHPDRQAAQPAEGGLASDARAVRTTLTALNAEHEQRDPGRPEIDLRGLVADLLHGEVAAPTADVARLVRDSVDPDAFYDKEIAPSWDGLNENQRAGRVEQFVGLARMLEDSEAGMELPNHDEMVATVRTKTLLLAFAVDETYGLMRQIERDPDAVSA